MAWAGVAICSLSAYQPPPPTSSSVGSRERFIPSSFVLPSPIMKRFSHQKASLSFPILNVLGSES